MLIINIDVDREVSALVKHRWTFTFIEHSGLVLRGYALLERKTTRHKHRATKYYSRDGERRYDSAFIGEADVPWDEAVKQAAKDQFMARMALYPVGRWAADFKNGRER